MTPRPFSRTLSETSQRPTAPPRFVWIDKKRSRSPIMLRCKPALSPAFVRLSGNRVPGIPQSPLMPPRAKRGADKCCVPQIRARNVRQTKVCVTQHIPAMLPHWL
jgi:hypothetical protein